jgi:hypothetical protein
VYESWGYIRVWKAEIAGLLFGVQHSAKETYEPKQALRNDQNSGLLGCCIHSRGQVSDQVDICGDDGDYEDDQELPKSFGRQNFFHGRPGFSF